MTTDLWEAFRQIAAESGDGPNFVIQEQDYPSRPPYTSGDDKIIWPDWEDVAKLQEWSDHIAGTVGRFDIFQLPADLLAPPAGVPWPHKDLIKEVGDMWK